MAIKNYLSIMKGMLVGLGAGVVLNLCGQALSPLLELYIIEQNPGSAASEYNSIIYRSFSYGFYYLLVNCLVILIVTYLSARFSSSKKIWIGCICGCIFLMMFVLNVELLQINIALYILSLIAGTLAIVVPLRVMSR